MASSSPCSVSGVGRIGVLGDFYNVKTDTFCGSNIFTKTIIPSSCLTRVENYSTDLKYIQGDSYEDKCTTLDVSAELKLSIMAGLFTLSGSGKYLNDRKSSSRVSSITLHYNIKTMIEKFNIFDPELRNLVSLDALKSTNGTHVVVEVVWGANAMLTFETTSEDSSDTTKVEGLLQAELKKAAFCISGQGSVDYKDSNLNKMKNLSLKVFGDILSNDDIPQNFEQALVYVRDLPSKARIANDGKGKPLSYGLFPIEMIKMYLQVEFERQSMIRSISECTITNFVHLFESIDKLKQELHALKEDVNMFEYVVSFEEKKLVHSLLYGLELYETNLKSELKESTIIVRNEDTESNLLEELYSKSISDPNAPNSLTATIENLTASISESTSFAKLMLAEGVSFVTSKDSLDNILLSCAESVEVYVLYTNRKNKSKNLADWNLNRRLFMALCRNSKKHGSADEFYIQDSSSSSQNGSEEFPTAEQISHYRGGKLITMNFASTNAQTHICIAKPSCSSTAPLAYKPNKRVPVELPCPGSIHGSCIPEPMIWNCWKCNTNLEYGFDNYFYCNCGQFLATNFMYKCTDLENHGFGFEVFSNSNQTLVSLLSRLRPRKEINILILGETGVGKSTWINGFVNYLTYPSLAVAIKSENVNLIPSSFTLTDETGKSIQISTGGSSSSSNECTIVGQSATQYPKSYVFPRGDTLIRIIDTPGIGDIRGLQKDKENFTNIMHHISHLDELHGICILLKPNNARLNVLFQFCIKELLTHLHKDAASNIMFCFTNARSTFYRPGDTKPALDKLLGENKSSADLTLTEHNMYCVDNESVRFLAAIQNDSIQFTDEETLIYASSWEKSVHETSRLLKHIYGLKPHSTKDTLSLNQARRLILALTEPIGHIAKNIEDNIVATESHEEELQKSLSMKEGYKKNLHIPKIDLVEEEIGYPTTVCASSKCTKSHQNIGDNKITVEYVQRCHEQCQLHNIQVGVYPQPGLQQCWAMNNHLKCNVCGCSWTEHLHITYKLNRVETIVVNEAVDQLLKATENRLEKVGHVLKQCKIRIEDLKRERETIAKVSCKFAAFLKANAITPYNDALINYLQHLIKLEESKIANGCEKTGLKGLQDMMRTYQQETAILEEALSNSTSTTKILTPNEIEANIQILYTLPTQGETLKRLVDVVNSATSKNYSYSEQIYVPKHHQHHMNFAPSSSSAHRAIGGGQLQIYDGRQLQIYKPQKWYNILKFW